jgi:hypothetical protein
MSDLDKIEANTAAIEANTEIMARLAVVWEKLYAKAVSMEANPDLPGLKAAGVPLVEFPKPPAPPTGFSL